jgi:hypothetical protein
MPSWASQWRILRYPTLVVTELVPRLLEHCRPDMHVPSRRRGRGVAEPLLNRAQINASLEQSGSASVATQVRV